MPREYMIEYRRKHNLTIDQMARLCDTPDSLGLVSPGLLRLLEEDENSVTHPNIARRVGAEYELSERRTLGLMPKHYRPGKHYDPDKYKITEDPEDIFRSFKVTKRSKGGAVV